ncbi:MAG: gliding motility-associated C-terminal domain-containing protein, partial [Chitinophagaceae bacterium]
TYFAGVTSAAGCTSLTRTPASLRIIETVVPVIAFNYNPSTVLDIDPNPSIQFGAGFVSGGVFSFTPQGLSFNTANGNINVSGSTPGDYTITYTLPALTLPQGCRAAATFNTPFKITATSKDVFVPNVFSPKSGNPANNVFKGFATGAFDYFRMTIFNQYGQAIKQINTFNEFWDGTFNGKDQPAGVYVYVLKYKRANQPEVTRKGSITLVR